MGITVSTGPSISAGVMAGYPGRAPDPNPMAGPSVTYQGDSIPDVRFQIIGASTDVGTIRAHLDSPYVLMTDAVPSASAAVPVNIAAAANTVSGSPMVLAGPSTGVVSNIPFFPLNVTADLGPINLFGDAPALQIAPLSLDLGFTTVATTAASPTVTLPSVAVATQNLFYIGQPVIVAGAGNPGGTTPLITTIAAISASGLVLTLANNALATLAAAPLGGGNILNPLSPAASTAWSPRMVAGVTAMFNPADAISRGWGVNCSAAGGGGTFTLRGWDIYGMAMSETLTHPGGNVVVYGKKTFKHILSVTPNFTDAGRTYSVGTSDLLGLHLRSDKIEYANFYANATFNGTAAGWTPADVTNPATPTTGDVRGTVQIGNRGPLGTNNGFGTTALGGFRVAFFTSIPLLNLVAATPTNPAPLYGSIQA